MRKISNEALLAMQGSSISFWKTQRHKVETEPPEVSCRGERIIHGACGTTSNTHLYIHETVAKTNSDWQLVERPQRRRHQVQTDLNPHCDWFTALYRSCLFAFLLLIAATTAWQIIHVCVISWVTHHWYSPDSWCSIPLDPELETVIKKTDILQ